MWSHTPMVKSTVVKSIDFINCFLSKMAPSVGVQGVKTGGVRSAVKSPAHLLTSFLTDLGVYSVTFQ